MLMYWQKCPVCNGRGHLPHGFYTNTNPDGYGTSNSTAPETCKTCLGQGVIEVNVNE